jgi:farnesyl-diphosphate farnesyltransferase
MGALEILSLALTHPNEFRILLQFWNYYEPKRDITSKEEHPSSGWDRPTMRRCWDLLDLTSRSFAAVIKELDGDLARVVSLPSLFRRSTYFLRSSRVSNVTLCENFLPPSRYPLAYFLALTLAYLMFGR